MITGSFLALALFLGYAVTIGLSMAATFGISAASPSFVAENYRIRRRYKFVQDVVWLVCTTAGGYVAALVIGSTRPWLGGVGLVAILLGVLWTNAWEMRQRGTEHQIVMSLVTAAGVAAGFIIRLG
jgi:uncharacterized oligopeptide transporter (OPT) family protein